MCLCTVIAIYIPAIDVTCEWVLKNAIHIKVVLFNDVLPSVGHTEILPVLGLFLS